MPGEAPGGYTKSFNRKLMAAYLEAYFQYRLEDYYTRVQCPLLLLPGADVFDNPLEKAAMEGLKALAPHAEVAVVPGWEHPYGWLVDPQPACQAILDFLRWQINKSLFLPIPVHTASIRRQDASLCLSLADAAD